MFYEKYFRFLKKLNASEFASASSFFLQSAIPVFKKVKDYVGSRSDQLIP